jgi:hypothetical protein
VKFVPVIVMEDPGQAVRGEIEEIVGDAAGLKAKTIPAQPDVPERVAIALPVAPAVVLTPLATPTDAQPEY